MTDATLTALATEAAAHSDSTPDELAFFARAFVDAHAGDPQSGRPGGPSLEIGTRAGGSAWLFCRLLTALYGQGKEPPLVSVDPYGNKPYPDGQRVWTDNDYGDGHYTAMRILLADQPHHVHFRLTSQAFLTRLLGIPLWQRGVPVGMTRFQFALLDGQHDAETITNEVATLEHHMAPGGVLLVDNIDLDPRTVPTLAQRWQFEFDGTGKRAVLREKGVWG